MRIWDAEDGQCLLTFDGHSDSVYAVALSADGRQVVSSSATGDVRIWGSTTGEELRDLPTPKGWQVARSLVRWLAAVRDLRMVQELLKSVFVEKGDVTIEGVEGALTARATLSEGVLQRARTVVERLVPLASDQTWSLDNRAWRVVDPDRTSSGDMAVALVYARAAVSRMPDSSTLQRHLAWALLANGNRADAIAAARQALMLATADEAVECQNTLDRLEPAPPELRAGPDCPEFDPESPEESDVAIVLRRDLSGRYVPKVKGLRFGAELYERNMFGFTSSPPSSGRARELGLVRDESLVVSSVTLGSAAESAGLRPDDMITRVAGRYASLRTLGQAKEERDFGDIVPFEVLRGEQTLHIEIPIGVSVRR